MKVGGARNIVSLLAGKLVLAIPVMLSVQHDMFPHVSTRRCYILKFLRDMIKMTLCKMRCTREAPIRSNGNVCIL